MFKSLTDKILDVVDDDTSIKVLSQLSIVIEQFKSEINKPEFKGLKELLLAFCYFQDIPDPQSILPPGFFGIIPRKECFQSEVLENEIKFTLPVILLENTLDDVLSANDFNMTLSLKLSDADSLQVIFSCEGLPNQYIQYKEKTMKSPVQGAQEQLEKLKEEVSQYRRQRSNSTPEVPSSTSPAPTLSFIPSTTVSQENKVRQKIEQYVDQELAKYTGHYTSLPFTCFVKIDYPFATDKQVISILKLLGNNSFYGRITLTEAVGHFYKYQQEELIIRLMSMMPCDFGPNTPDHLKKDKVYHVLDRANDKKTIMLSFSRGTPERTDRRPIVSAEHAHIYLRTDGLFWDNPTGFVSLDSLNSTFLQGNNINLRVLIEKLLHPTMSPILQFLFNEMPDGEQTKILSFQDFQEAVCYLINFYIEKYGNGTALRFQFIDSQEPPTSEELQSTSPLPVCPQLISSGRFFSVEKPSAHDGSPQNAADGIKLYVDSAWDKYEEYNALLPRSKFVQIDYSSATDNQVISILKLLGNNSFYGRITLSEAVGHFNQHPQEKLIMRLMSMYGDFTAQGSEYWFLDRADDKITIIFSITYRGSKDVVHAHIYLGPDGRFLSDITDTRLASSNSLNSTFLQRNDIDLRVLIEKLLHPTMSPILQFLFNRMPEEKQTEMLGVQDCREAVCYLINFYIERHGNHLRFIDPPELPPTSPDQMPMSVCVPNRFFSVEKPSANDGSPQNADDGCVRCYLPPRF